MDRKSTLKKTFNRSYSLDSSANDKTPGSKMKVQLHEMVLKNSVNSLGDYLSKRRKSKLNGTDDLGNTPLHTAARFSREEGVKMLLMAGADPNKPAENGFTPLHEASENGSSTIVSLMVQNPNCDVNVQDESGNTPLMRAAYYDYKDIVEILFKAGANLNCRNNSGQTALIISLWEGSENTAEFLIKQKCDLNQQDNSSHTPFYVAVHSELLPNLRIAKLIIDEGYDVRHDSWWLVRAPFRSKLALNDKFCQKIMEKIDMPSTISE